MSEERDVEQWARAEADALSEQCTCATTYANYEGPEVDCPVHGAVKALNEVMFERDAARATLDRCAAWVSDLLDDYGLGRPDSLAGGLDQVGEAFRLADWLHAEAMWLAREEQARRDQATGTAIRSVIADLLSEAAFRAPVGIADPIEISHDDHVAAAALREYADRLAKHSSLLGDHGAPQASADALRRIFGPPVRVGSRIVEDTRPRCPAESKPHKEHNGPHVCVLHAGHDDDHRCPCGYDWLRRAENKRPVAMEAESGRHYARWVSGGETYAARCNCGWSGPERQAQSEAISDLNEHEAH